MYKTEKFRGELKYCYTGKRAGISKKIHAGARKEKGGRRITDVNGIVSVSEGGHIQEGESLCLCLLGRAAF